MDTQVARNARLTALQILTSAAVLFLLYRFLVRAIGIEAIGVWSVVLATTSVSRLADLGVSGSTTRFVARALAQGSHPTATDYAQTAVLLAAGLYLVLAFVAYPILKQVLHVVVPNTHLQEARALLPFALVSFWMASVTTVLQGTIDGTHRIDLKSYVIILGSLFYLGSVLLLVPRSGLMGLAYAQVLQSVTLLVASWLLLRKCLAGLPPIPSRWDPKAFREIIGFGTQLQVIGLTVVLSDPVTKSFLSRFGGLSAVGYYEMASRMVQQVRGLLVNVNQVLVPTIADLQHRDVGGVAKVYADSYSVMAYLSLPLFSGLIALIPLISEWWIGRYEPTFVSFAVLLACAWLTNILSAPAYFAGVGTGRLKWNFMGHVVQAASNVVLGGLLGWTLGGLGVVVGAAIAVAAGSLVTILGYHAAQGGEFTALLTRYAAELGAGCLAISIAAIATYYILRLQGHASLGTATILAVMIVIPTLFWLTWRHPLRTRLVRWALSSADRTGS